MKYAIGDTAYHAGLYGYSYEKILAIRDGKYKCIHTEEPGHWPILSAYTSVPCWRESSSLYPTKEEALEEYHRLEDEQHTTSVEIHPGQIVSVAADGDYCKTCCRHQLVNKCSLGGVKQKLEVDATCSRWKRSRKCMGKKGVKNETRAGQ